MLMQIMKIKSLLKSFWVGMGKMVVATFVKGSKISCISSMNWCNELTFLHVDVNSVELDVTSVIFE